MARAPAIGGPALICGMVGIRNTTISSGLSWVSKPRGGRWRLFVWLHRLVLAWTVIFYRWSPIASTVWPLLKSNSSYRAVSEYRRIFYRWCERGCQWNASSATSLVPPTSRLAAGCSLSGRKRQPHTRKSELPFHKNRRADVENLANCLCIIIRVP